VLVTMRGFLADGMGVALLGLRECELVLLPPIEMPPLLAFDVRMKKPVRRESMGQGQARRGDRGGLTVIELAAETGWSATTLRRMFQDEPGVSRIQHPEALHRRGYVSVRIPRHVADRVLARYAHRI
jgi:AraC-like DNA-binding protein